MEYSEQQKAIFYDAAENSNNIIIGASAGSGKTTTLLALFDYLNWHHQKSSKEKPKILMLAFNKAIASEISKKVKKMNRDDIIVNVRTSHSLGFYLLKNLENANLNIVNYKYTKRMKDIIISDKNIFNLSFREQNQVIYKDMADFQEIFKDLNFERYNGLYNDNIDYNLDSFLAKYLLRDKNLKKNLNEYRKYLSYILDGVNDLESIDFTDMLYIPVNSKSKTLISYDYVLVDEAQDLNFLQIELIKKVYAKKYIFVGDPCQAIYAFAGALNDSFDKVKNAFNCDYFPLSQTFRCPENIVDFVNSVYEKSDIYTLKDTVAEIEKTAIIPYLKEFKAKELILCHRNAPLIKLFLKRITAKKPTIINKSGELFKELYDFIEKNFYSKIDDISINKTIKRLIDNLNDKNLLNEELAIEIANLLDKRESIIAFYNYFGKLKKLDFINAIKSLVKNLKKKDACLLSTIHKAKGLEADNVSIIDFDILQGLASIALQADNLMYVALTRTKSKLRLFYDKLENIN